jgi:hypothetical protein
MNEKDNISSILNAMDEINTKKSREKSTTIISNPNIIPKLNHNLEVSPDINRLITEAEKYKDDLKLVPSQSKYLGQKKDFFSNQDVLILTNEVIDPAQIKPNDIMSLTILNLQKKIKNLQTIEEKLRFRIIDLEQDKLIVGGKNKFADPPNDIQNFIDATKNSLNSIYKKVEKQKKIFQELKNHSIKIEQDSNFYKENYERLVVENNDIKKR